MTLRPSATGRAPENADALAEVLRTDTASDADLARMESRLVSAMRDRRRAPSRAPRWAMIGVGLAVAAAAVFYLSRPVEGPHIAERPMPIVPAPVDTTPGLAIGSELTHGEGQLAHARLSVTAGSRAHVDDDALAHAAVTLAQGEIRVAFHPEHRGDEHLAIVTDLARVEVVGTEFVVTRRGDGATHVAVSEGVVRVITLATGEAHAVARGESYDVMPSVVAIEAPPPTTRRVVERLPTIDEAIAAAATGDLSVLESLAERGDREARISALEELMDHHRATPAAAIEDCDRILAIDPHGARGATALYDRARLREDRHDAAAVDDFARYLSEFPSGSFAADAARRLCSLDSSRCSRP